jgi:WD40 repeat protein
VSSVDFSCDARLTATGSTDGTFAIWDAADGSRRRYGGSRAHLAGVRHLAFSVDGSSLVSAGSDGNVIVWRSPGWKASGAVQGYVPGSFSCALSPDGSTVVVPSDDRGAVYDIASGNLKRTIFYSGKHAQCAAISEDGSLAAVGGTHGLEIYDTASWLMKRHIVARGDVLHVAFVPGQRLLAYGSNIHSDGLRLVDAATGLEVRRFPLNGYVHDLAVSGHGRMLVALGQDGAVVFDVDSGAEVARRSGPGSTGNSRTDSSVALSPDGRLLAMGLYGGDVIAWDLVEGGEPVKIGEHAGNVRAVAFSADGALLASGSADTSVLVWSVESCLGPHDAVDGRAKEPPPQQAGRE